MFCIRSCICLMLLSRVTLNAFKLYIWSLPALPEKQTHDFGIASATHYCLCNVYLVSAVFQLTKSIWRVLVNNNSTLSDLLLLTHIWSNLTLSCVSHRNCVLYNLYTTQITFCWGSGCCGSNKKCKFSAQTSRSEHWCVCGTRLRHTW